LPSLRRQGRGRVPTIGAIVGLVPETFGTCLASSQHTIEGYSDSHDVRSG